MINHDQRWSLPRGNTPVPSRWQATPWLARWSATQGWIGFAREELSLIPWLTFYAQDGHAYLAAPGEAPQPVRVEAPPFSATHTTERQD